MNWVVRLGGFFVCLLLCAGSFLLALKFPGRSANTGLPDSGCFGWVCAVLLIMSICSLCGMFDKDKKS